MLPKESRNYRIAVVTGITSAPVSEVLMENFLELMEPLSSSIYAITGKLDCGVSEKVEIIRIRSDFGKKESRLLKIIKYFPQMLLVQLAISLQLLKISRRIDIVIFQSGTRLYTLPLITAKLLGKKTVSCVTGLQSTLSPSAYQDMLLGDVAVKVSLVMSKTAEWISHFLSDQISVESRRAADFMGLTNHRKIAINGGMYVDTGLFRINKEIENRGNLIGYVGRLFTSKGVISFVKAIPLILKQMPNVDFIVVGEGRLFDWIQGEIKDKELSLKVRLDNWIPHHELPELLNRLKLFVFPSYSEGLPAIVQEAMACGVVVLATPVGGVPDLIKDGETGFILEDNSPECIARNVIKALEHPGLDKIASNARKLIEDEHNYEALVEKWRISLSRLR